MKSLPLLIACIAFMSTLCGGLFSLKYRDKLHRILGYTAGVIMGVVVFDIIPEIFKDIQNQNLTTTIPMIVFITGFLLFHIIEKTILIHHSNESEYEVHKHPQVGVASALALCGHSFLDGIGIGIGFQVSNSVGIAIAIAVIAHDFSDGINTVSLMLVNKNTRDKAFKFLLLDAFAPVLGILSTFLFVLPHQFVVYYLCLFAGFLLYIGASEILPEAHSDHSSYKTVGLTILGVVFMFVVTRFI